MARASQLKAVEAQKRGFFTGEIVPVVIPQRTGEPLTVAADEHPRQTTLEALARPKGVVRADGTVTAGHASGVTDGACALLMAKEEIGGAPVRDRVVQYEWIPMVDGIFKNKNRNRQ